MSGKKNAPYASFHEVMLSKAQTDILKACLPSRTDFILSMMKQEQIKFLKILLFFGSFTGVIINYDF